MSVLPVLLLLLQVIITVHTELVVVPVVVTDAQGLHVDGLTQDNFHVYEDGRLRPTSVFLHGDAPITLGLVVDRSSSMRTKADALFTVVSRLLLSARPDDELFGVNFNDRVSLALPEGRPFTSVGGEILAAAAAAQAEGLTALYDGVAEGLRHLKAGHGERRALVVISDGGDNGSTRKYADILALARQSDTVIYAIGLLGTSPSEDDEDAGLLKRICRDTGGVAYFPRTAAEIATVSTRVAADLRAQYTLGFTPGERPDARGFRKIDVKVTVAGQGRLHVRTRTGYLSTAGNAGP